MGARAFTSNRFPLFWRRTSGGWDILHAKQGRLTDALNLDANYVRRSDAELHWKAPAGTLNIRDPSSRGDAEAILGIQAESPEIAQWSKGAYERLAQENMAGWAAESNGSISGFITARQMAGDIEILNFAVRHECARGKAWARCC